MSKLGAAFLALVAVLAVSVPPARAQAQAWPQQPVKLIVPFGPGAGADIGARLIQDRLQTRWGKPVVIENRPGGDSMIAIQAVLSANDDHTFLWGPSGSFIVHPYQYKKLPVAVSNDKAIDDKLNATAQTPSRGGAKEFAASIERQRAQIATIAKALGIQPTR